MLLFGGDYAYAGDDQQYEEIVYECDTDGLNDSASSNYKVADRIATKDDGEVSN